MKSRTIVLLTLLLAGIVIVVVFARWNAGDKTAENIVAVGFRAPELRVADIDSSSGLASSDLKGKVLFVNFWASWCDPCKEEMPSVDDFFQEFKGRSDFRMITILYRDNPANGVSYMKSKGFSFPVYADPGAVSSRNFGVTGVPETYVIDKKGILRKKMIGPADWSTPEEKNFVSSLLAE